MQLDAASLSLLCINPFAPQLNEVASTSPSQICTSLLLLRSRQRGGRRLARLLVLLPRCLLAHSAEVQHG